MENIKFRLSFAFMIGMLYSAVYGSIGMTSQSSKFGVGDALLVSLFLFLVILFTVLATSEHIKNNNP